MKTDSDANSVHGDEQLPAATGSGFGETSNEPETCAVDEFAASQDSQADAQGIDFLTQLEHRHSKVLDELDALNQRIEQVIEGYQQGRRTAATSEPQSA